jgi:cation-transporting ATPase I
MKGVDWVELDVALGRIVVAFDDDVVELDDVISAIVAVRRFPHDEPEHPADPELLRRHVLALGADAAGLGLGLFGRALRSTPLPVELASIVSMIDNQARLRRLLEENLGVPLTDLGLVVANALGQGLTGPLGLLVDMAHRANLLAETLDRRQAFSAAEQRRGAAGPSRCQVALPLPTQERPVRLPAGPVERYSDRAGVAALGAAAATYFATASPRRAAAVLVAGVPKASRLGREAFAAHLCRAHDRSYGGWRRPVARGRG